ncbi:MAG: hypothetical protein IJ265_02940 [Oscillospiraceae bacterium]|nr:hypothetical protein [Oscillospiraceae bacterium]
MPVGYRENGSIRYKSVYARTLAEVKQKMAELYAAGQEKPVSSLKLTVQEAAEQWLISAKLRVKPSSYANYLSIVNKHILPILGSVRMTDLTASRMNDFIMQKLQHGKRGAPAGIRCLMCLRHKRQHRFYILYNV